jgi:peptidoglycan-associated lipoprotein
MNRVITVLSLLVLSAGLACKKQVAVDDLPAAGAEAPAALLPAPPEVIEQMVRNFQRVYFEFDSADLSSGSKDALLANVRLMQEHPELGLLIQGHCDERGTTDYNLALGDRRARAVHDTMKAAGVAPSRLRTLSLGEEAPLVADSGEHAWSQNRRAEFVIVGDAAGLVRGTTP